MIHKLSNMNSREMMPGFHGKFIHGERLTMAFWDIDKCSSLPSHSHEHEQTIHVLEGTFELNVEGTVHLLSEGDVLVIPSNISHAGKAVSDCRILDVFVPIRKEFL